MRQPVPTSVQGAVGRDASQLLRRSFDVVGLVFLYAHAQFANAGIRTTLDYDDESQTLTLERQRLEVRLVVERLAIEIRCDNQTSGALHVVGGLLVDAEGEEVLSAEEFFGAFAVRLVQAAFPHA